MGRPEFIALMAMMFATIAFSIDAMLPALPKIASELSPQEPSRAALILTSFILGMGIGTFFPARYLMPLVAGRLCYGVRDCIFFRLRSHG